MSFTVVPTHYWSKKTRAKYLKSLEIHNVVSDTMRVMNVLRWLNSSVETYAAILCPITATSACSSKLFSLAGLKGAKEMQMLCSRVVESRGNLPGVYLLVPIYRLCLLTVFLPGHRHHGSFHISLDLGYVSWYHPYFSLCNWKVHPIWYKRTNNACWHSASDHVHALINLHQHLKLQPKLWQSMFRTLQ